MSFSKTRLSGGGIGQDITEYGGLTINTSGGASIGIIGFGAGHADSYNPRTGSTGTISGYSGSYTIGLSTSTSAAQYGTRSVPLTRPLQFPDGFLSKYRKRFVTKFGTCRSKKC